ncbi:hypothetical protein KR018_011425 [Drosophila ironensis]|nr:hypothetical protein KR018_011425 [Drosophila ironensis]
MSGTPSEDGQGDLPTSNDNVEGNENVDDLSNRTDEQKADEPMERPQHDHVDVEQHFPGYTNFLQRLFIGNEILNNELDKRICRLEREFRNAKIMIALGLILLLSYYYYLQIFKPTLSMGQWVKRISNLYIYKF